MMEWQIHLDISCGPLHVLSMFLKHSCELRSTCWRRSTSRHQAKPASAHPTMRGWLLTKPWRQWW